MPKMHQIDLHIFDCAKNTTVAQGNMFAPNMY